MLGHITGEQTSHIAEAIATLEADKLTFVFRRIGMFSLDGGRRDLKPLLTSEEKVSNTCFDGDYYTFATDRAAADRMFSDTISIKQLMACIASKPNDKTVADLTIIRGRKLAFLDEEIIDGEVVEKKAYVQRT